MYQIALCDDDAKELDKVADMLESYCGQAGAKEFLVRRFDSGDSLLETAGKTDYAPDLVFMDIYMPGSSGIEAAKKLKKMGRSCGIIFLTSSRDHALDAFSVDALQYLVKPVSRKTLFSVMDKAVARVREENYLLFETDSQVCRVTVSDIVYCEANRKKQCVRLRSGESLFLSMTMAKLGELLFAYRDFAKVGVSYIVNLAHVEQLDRQTLLMDDGSTIHLPRGSYSALREKYFSYYLGITIDTL